MKLEWKSYGDRGRTAKSDHGTWRIVDGHDAWWLSLEPPSTRGMADRGKFDDRQRAMDFAQERENDVANPADAVGTVRHKDGVYAIMTVEGEWFTTHPVDGLQRWFEDIPNCVRTWDVVFRPDEHCDICGCPTCCHDGHGVCHALDMPEWL